MCIPLKGCAKGAKVRQLIECAAAQCVLCHVQIDKVVCRRCVFPWKRSYSRTCKAVPPEVKLDQGRWLCVLCIWERKYSIEIPEEDLTDTVRMQLRKLEDTARAFGAMGGRAWGPH